MAAGGKQVTRWLKEATCLLPSAVADTHEDVTRVSTTSSEALGLLRDFWRRVWNRTAPASLLADCAQNWQAQTQAATPWRAGVTHMTLAALHACAQKAKHSSAGPDGIAVQDLAYMPLTFWQLLLDRVQVWQECGVFPAVWQHCRTVLIPNDEPSSKGQPTNASRMRPISAFCGVYRALVAAWTVHPSTRRWFAETAPPGFFGGIKGRSAEQAIRRLNEAWCEESVLFSLDVSLCFDHVRPELAPRALELYGAPEVLLSILRWVWRRQQRWLQFGAETLPVPAEVSSTLPQGCPRHLWLCC